MINRFYILLIITNLLLLTACDEEPKNIKDIPKVKEVKVTPKVIREKPPQEYKFIFTDLVNQTQRVTIKNHHYSFLDIKESIVMIIFFSTWCPPCLGQIPHLNKLQKRYKDKVSVFGLLVHDNIKNIELDRFIESQKINFFISSNQDNNIKFSNFISPKLQLNSNFAMPVMILFVKGRYYTHYVGSIPEEMIESDIRQALKKLEG